MRAEIRAAVWAYRTAAGHRRLAYFGDVVELTDEEHARAERAGVLSQLDPFAVATPPPVTVVDDDGEAVHDEASGDAPEPAQQSGEPAAAEAPRPIQSGPKSAWVDFAVSKGATREEAEAATKQELIVRYGS